MEVKSYKEFVSKAMPENKKVMANKCIVGHYLLRPISHLIAIPLVIANVSPILVTKISMVFVFLSLVTFLLADSLSMLILAWVFLLIWNILDGVDGDIARFTETTSPLGGLWDATVGWLATIVFYVGMGCAAIKLPSEFGLEFLDDCYLFFGCVSALCWIFPRLVMHKKLGLFGKESVVSVQDREHFGPLKLIYFNLTSINGIGALVFLVAMVIGLSNICVLVYMALSLVMATFSCASLLREEK